MTIGVFMKTFKHDRKVGRNTGKRTNAKVGLPVRHHAKGIARARGPSNSTGHGAQVSVKRSITEQKPPKKQLTAKEKREKLYIPEPKLARGTLNAILADNFATDYLRKNVSKNAIDVLGVITTPKTAEQVSAILDIKINFVRSMLNIMQGYGITNYYVAKNDNGWLSFAWYINTAKFQSFFDYIRSIKSDEIVIKDDCNDYFICAKCYNNTKLIFAFDSAYEAGFKCRACGGKFKMINRDEAESLVKAQSGPVPETAKT